MSLCTALGEGKTIDGIALMVTGGRHYDNREHVFLALDRVDVMFGTIGCVVQGMCPGGADRWAREWAASRLRPCPTTFEADWDAAEKMYGRRDIAGPLRNQRMADTHPDFCLAFPGGRGTASAIACALRAGVKVITMKDLRF